MVLERARRLYPRATVDIDIWIDVTQDNVSRVWRALGRFRPAAREVVR